MTWYVFSLFMFLRLFWYYVVLSPRCLQFVLLPLSPFFLLVGGVSSYDRQSSERRSCSTLSIAFPIMGEEPPSGGLAEETGQPMQGSQDFEASKIPASQSPQLERTPSPIRTVFPQTLSVKETLGDTPLSKQTSEPYFPLK